MLVIFEEYLVEMWLKVVVSQSKWYAQNGRQMIPDDPVEISISKFPK